MKKILKVFLIFLIINSFIYSVYASENGILESQKENLNISDFINNAKKYTKDTFGNNVQMDDILESALTGKIDNNSIYKSIFNLFGKEVKNSLKTFRCYYSSNSNT